MALNRDRMRHSFDNYISFDNNDQSLKEELFFTLQTHAKYDSELKGEEEQRYWRNVTETKWEELTLKGLKVTPTDISRLNPKWHHKCTGPREVRILFYNETQIFTFLMDTDKLFYDLNFLTMNIPEDCCRNVMSFLSPCVSVEKYNYLNNSSLLHKSIGFHATDKGIETQDEIPLFTKEQGISYLEKQFNVKLNNMSIKILYSNKFLPSINNIANMAISRATWHKMVYIVRTTRAELNERKNANIFKVYRSLKNIKEKFKEIHLKKEKIVYKKLGIPKDRLREFGNSLKGDETDDFLRSNFKKIRGMKFADMKKTSYNVINESVIPRRFLGCEIAKVMYSRIATTEERVTGCTLFNINGTMYRTSDYLRRRYRNKPFQLRLENLFSMRRDSQRNILLNIKERSKFSGFSFYRLRKEKNW